MKEKKKKLWLYCIQVLYRHVVPCFHNTTYKYRKGMKGPVINYYSVSQIILSIVLSLTKRPNLLPSLSIVFLDNGVVQLFLVQCCPHAFLCDLCWTIWTIPPRKTQDDAWPFI